MSNNQLPFEWTKEKTNKIKEAINHYGHPLPISCKKALAKEFGVSEPAVRAKARRTFKNMKKQAEKTNTGTQVNKTSTVSGSDMGSTTQVIENNEDFWDKLEKDVISEEIFALEKKLVAEKDKTSKAMSLYRKIAKEQGNMESMVEAIKENAPIMPDLPKDPIKPNKSKQSQTLVVHYSDEHIDEVVLPEKVGGLEDYNLNVYVRRAEDFTEKVVRFAETLNVDITDVCVLFYGDHVTGNIHGHEPYSFFQNTIPSAIAAGQIHAMFLRDMASKFKKVNAIYVPGNHGRLTEKKDYKNPLRNLDYLAAEYCVACTKDIEGLETYIFPANTSVNVEINGWVFNISHGDDITAVTNPINAAKKRSEKLNNVFSMIGHTINYKVMGHFHSMYEAADPTGATIINGTWLATNEYAFGKGLANEPVQLVHCVDYNDGITYSQRIKVRTEDEKAPPKRYKIKLGADFYQEKIRFGVL